MKFTKIEESLTRTHLAASLIDTENAKHETYEVRRSRRWTRTRPPERRAAFSCRTDVAFTAADTEPASAAVTNVDDDGITTEPST